MSLNRHGVSVTLRSLAKTYGEFRVIDKLTIDIQPGEFVTLLGPSGSGKTTTLMLVAGFIYPDEGEILKDQEDITFKPPNRRNIGMVFQNYALFPHMSVFENIAFPLRMRKIQPKEITRRIKEALEMVALAGYENRRPNQLSGGQQQRIALARALVFEPSLLLMDEPLGALDKQLRVQMQMEIKHLQKRVGCTTIYVTHDQEEALVMSDRIAIMRAGKLIQVGTPQEIYEFPNCPFVGTFIGESNVLKGTLLEHEADRATLQTLGGAKVTGRCRWNVGQGSQAVIVFRPEKTTLSREKGGGNLLSGNIEEVTYMGEGVVYTVRIAGGEKIRIKNSNTSQAFRGKVGEKAYVGWEVMDASILPPDEEVKREDNANLSRGET